MYILATSCRGREERKPIPNTPTPTQYKHKIYYYDIWVPNLENWGGGLKIFILLVQVVFATTGHNYFYNTLYLLLYTGHVTSYM